MRFSTCLQWCCWLLLSLSLSGSGWAQGLDESFGVPKYLVLIVRQNTQNGVTEPNVYQLFNVPHNGHVGLSDGTGGVFWSDVELIGGPYYTLREVCDLAPNEKAKRDCGCPTPNSLAPATGHDGEWNQGADKPSAFWAWWNQLPTNVRALAVSVLGFLIYGLFQSGQTGTPATPAAAQMLAIAQGKIGSQDYLFGVENRNFPAGKNKCNLMVADVIEEAGLPLPLIERFPRPPRRPSANEWANPNQPLVAFHPGTSIVAGHWQVLPKGDSPLPGDILATAGDESGHVGIVADTGHSISTDNNFPDMKGIVHFKDWGFRTGESPTFRRWVPESQSGPVPRGLP